MSGHAVIGALTGLVVLAAHILVTGDPRTALAVWAIGALAGGLASFLWSALADRGDHPTRHGSLVPAVRPVGVRARQIRRPKARHPAAAQPAAMAEPR